MTLSRYIRSRKWRERVHFLESFVIVLLLCVAAFGYFYLFSWGSC